MEDGELDSQGYPRYRFRSAIFRIHLSTCVILVIAAGAMLGGNLVPHAARGGGTPNVGWPMDYAECRPPVWCEKCQAFHLPWYDGGRVFADIVACVGLLLLLGIVAEHLAPAFFRAVCRKTGSPSVHDERTATPAKAE
jgi:hypothetical protein